MRKLSGEWTTCPEMKHLEPDLEVRQSEFRACALNHHLSSLQHHQTCLVKHLWKEWNLPGKGKTHWIHWRRPWHPTPVLLPGKSHGQGSLVGCSPWGRRESDTTERLHFTHFILYHWRRKWQPTPVFLPGESQGRGSLVGCRLWGRTESDTTEVT